MSTDFTALLGQLPGQATFDPATGQARYPSGVRVCYHAGAIETVRESSTTTWCRERDGVRWTLRRSRTPVQVLTLSCPDCPAVQQHFVPAGRRLAAALAPYVFPKGVAA